jgi:carbon storage regulator
MLVLTRKRGERIMIGDNVVVTILEVSGDQVRVGIEAPRSVSVMREELQDQVAEANRGARLNKNIKFNKKQ